MLLSAKEEGGLMLWLIQQPSPNGVRILAQRPICHAKYLSLLFKQPSRKNTEHKLSLLSFIACSSQRIEGRFSNDIIKEETSFTCHITSRAS